MISWFAMSGKSTYARKRRKFLIDMGYLSEEGCVTELGLKYIKGLWQYHYSRSLRDIRLFLSQLVMLVPCENVKTEFEAILREAKEFESKILNQQRRGRHGRGVLRGVTEGAV